MSEIDDIFASKAKAKAPPSMSISGPKKDLPISSSKKEKKRKRTISNSAPLPSQKPTENKPVETVVDTSSQPAPAAKRLKAVKKPDTSKQKPVGKTAKEDEEKFKDSRGTGPRRKTEEGWSIYKVDELGIDEESGGSPLCPFDCNCCF
ncbi:DUF1764-domain-containing protein [Dendrothele bispora CBS 962.96]|uniref:DUF1764-domain-containing protein n=1 Tax=Dendrothele bispora (strain CBS 962.96) TaxID=1314807 RepID=A0A4S8LR82_DENBC|nr:DUF1764-domain-containing protein [Dendrothele bispora CBS 962.96]